MKQKPDHFGDVMKDKKAIYDEQIAPLVAQLIEVCQSEGIPFFASF